MPAGRLGGLLSLCLLPALLPRIDERVPPDVTIYLDSDPETGRSTCSIVQRVRPEAVRYGGTRWRDGATTSPRD